MKGMERPTPVDQNKDRPAESFMLLLNNKENTNHTPITFYLLLIHCLQVKKSLQDCRLLPSSRPTFGCGVSHISLKTR